MVAYEEMEVRLHSFVNSALDGGEWSGLYPVRVGPRVGLHPLFLSGNEIVVPRVSGQSPSHYVD